MKVHFIAIGGSVMHNLALTLKAKGDIVSGSDDEIFEPARGHLKKAGLLPVEEGWFPEKISPDLDALILGMHAKNDNPELITAKNLKIPIYSFPEFLYKHSQNKKRIVIGGSHGKTTITAMIMHVIKDMDINFDYMVGAHVKGFDVMVRLSDEASLMIFEGDEYLSSVLDKRPKFHVYKPHIAVISGIEWDHMNVFQTKQIYIEQFEKFVHLTEKNGVIIYCKEDNLVQQIVDKFNEEVLKIPYDIPEHEIINGKCLVIHNEKKYEIRVFGKHNLLNLNAARTVCNQLGIDDDSFLKSIRTYEGASNRLELLAENKTVSVFRDFAHAPSKLKATIEAVKSRNPERKLVAVIELHTYSSLNKKFLPEYRGSMDLADQAIVFFNPHAFEIKKLPILDKNDVRNSFKRKDLIIFNKREELEIFLKSIKWKNKNLLLMSSGNFGDMDLENMANRIVSN